MLAILLLAPVAVAAPNQNQPGNPPPVTAPVTAQPAPGTGLLGVPDGLQQLNGGQTDPACRTGGLSAEVVRDCQASGEPFSAYPAGNYGTDTNVNTGFLDTDVPNVVASLLQSLVSYLIMGMAAVMSVMFGLLSLVFNLDVFSAARDVIPSALRSMEANFTIPMLPVLLPLGGLFSLMYYAQDDHRRSLGHVLAMCVLIVFGLWVIADPWGALGGLDGEVNGAAQAGMAAGSLRPGQVAGAYADATPSLWRVMVEEPWCAVEFGDVSQFCMAPVSPGMRAAEAATLRHLPVADTGKPTVSVGGAPGTIVSVGGSSIARQQMAVERVRLADARTNGELFLSFPTNWDARNGGNDSWTLYHEIDRNAPQYADIRWAGGVGQRIINLALISVGLIFAIGLLVYIFSYLFLAAVFFVVLLMATPFTVLLPIFGDRGRRGFVNWLAHMLGALAAKLIYAVYLGLMVAVSDVLIRTAPALSALGYGWLTQSFLFAMTWALAFVYRRRLPEMLWPGQERWHGGGHAAIMRGVTAYAGYRLAKSALRGHGGSGGGGGREDERGGGGGRGPKPPPRPSDAPEPVFADEPVRVTSWQHDGETRELPVPPVAVLDGEAWEE